MKTLRSTEAKKTFSPFSKKVVTARTPLVVKFPFGFMKSEPWEIPEEAPEFPKGTIRPSKREIELGNNLGDTR